MQVRNFGLGLLVSPALNGKSDRRTIDAQF